MIYKTCAYCKASLDPCERCDCQDDEPERAGAGGDCQGCWCNTCANIHQCINDPFVPEENQIPGSITHPGEIRPYPCIGCDDAKRYMPILPKEEHCTCAGYAEAAHGNEEK